MHKLLRSITILTLIILMVFFLPGSSIAQDKGDEMIRNLVEELKHEVEMIRGLEYIEDVGSRLVTIDELMEFLEREIDEQMPPEKEHAVNRVYGQLGLIPEGTKFIEVYATLLEDQAGGIYNPDDKELFVVASNLPGLSDEGDISGGMLGAFGMDPMMLVRTVLAHELCHALEDQHFQFNDTFESIMELSSSDREIALQCLIEGTATRLMIDHATGGIPMTPFQRNLNRILTNLLTEVTLNVPLYFKRTLTAPYVYGEIFVSKLIDIGGWETVNDVFEDYPTSMEQILHPDKFLINRDWPSDVTLADFAEIMGDGYEELMQDTLGEFLIDILLDIELNRDDFKDAPAGWDGDRLMGIMGPDDEVTIVWHTVWDSDIDAQEFTKAIKLHLAQRVESLHQNKSESYSTSEFCTYTDIDSREYYISRGFDEVIYIHNAPDGMAQMIYDAVITGDEVIHR